MLFWFCFIAMYCLEISCRNGLSMYMAYEMAMQFDSNMPPMSHSLNADNQFVNYMWTASSEFGTYSLCEQRRFRRACASVQSRQNLRGSLIQAVSKEEPSDRKPDP